MRCERYGCKNEATHWVAYKKQVLVRDQPQHRFYYCAHHVLEFKDASGVFAPGLNRGAVIK